MTITLLSCNDSPIKVNKAFTIVATLTTTKPYEPLNDLEGFVIIDYTASNFNYVLINGKYYFVTSREKLNGRNLQLNLKEDVLSTWKNFCNSVTVLPDRASFNFNSYMYDDQQKSQVDYDNFSFGFDAITSWKTIINVVGIRVDEDIWENLG